MARLGGFSPFFDAMGRAREKKLDKICKGVRTSRPLFVCYDTLDRAMI